MRSTFVLQDVVLNQIRREGTEAEFATVTGAVYHGKLHGFDAETVIVDLKSGKQIMLYKKCLISVLPDAVVLQDPSV